MSSSRISPRGPVRRASSTFREEEALRKLVKELKTPTEPSASPRRTSLYADPSDELFEAALDADKLNRNPAVKPRGASDPSNTCYRNAVIFTLLCNDTFMGFIRHHWIQRRQTAIAASASLADKNDLLTKKSPFELLSELWETYWAIGSSRGNLEGKVKSFWDQLTPLSGGTQDTPSWKDVAGHLNTQQDAKEFLDWILGCEQAMSKPLDDSKQGEKDQAPMFSDYDHIFKLQTSNWRICARCEHNTRAGTPEKNGQNMKVKSKRIKGQADRDDFVLRIPVHAGTHEPLNLLSLLWQHFKYSQNDFFCEDCLKVPRDQRAKLEKQNEQSGLHIPAWKYIGRLPEVLFVHLDRVGTGNIKIRSEVAIPQSFRMHSRFFKGDVVQDWEGIIDGTARPGKMREGKALEAKAREEGRKTNAAITPMYELVGVISHQGTANAGHYKTNVRVDSQWWDINRTNCTRSDGATAVSNKDGFDPVLLVWQRKYTGGATKGPGTTLETQDPVSGSMSSTKPAHASEGRLNVTEATLSGSKTPRGSIRGSRSSTALADDSKKNDTNKPVPENSNKAPNGKVSGQSAAVVQSAIDEEYWLRLIVQLQEREYLLHHQVHPMPELRNAVQHDKGPSVKMDLQIEEKDGTGTTFLYDLLGAARRARPGSDAQLRHGDYAAEATIPHAPCHCGDVHGGVCRTLKRKTSTVEEASANADSPEKRQRLLPPLFQRRGDDRQQYPSISERNSIQEAIDRTLRNLQERWQGRIPPQVRRRAIRKVRDLPEPRIQVDDVSFFERYANAAAQKPRFSEPPRTPERLVAPGGNSPPFTDPLARKRHILQVAAARRAKAMEGASMVEQLKREMMQGPVRAPADTRPYLPSRGSSATMSGAGLSGLPSSNQNGIKGYQSSQSRRDFSGAQLVSPRFLSPKVGNSAISQLRNAPRPPQHSPGAHRSSTPLLHGAVIQQTEEQHDGDYWDTAADERLRRELRASVAQTYKPPVAGAAATGMPGGSPDDPDAEDHSSGVPKHPKRPSPAPSSRRASRNDRSAAPQQPPPNPPAVPGAQFQQTGNGINTATWSTVLRHHLAHAQTRVNEFKKKYEGTPRSPRYVTGSPERIGKAMRKHPLVTGVAAGIAFSIWWHGKDGSIHHMKLVLRQLINAAEKGYFKSEALAQRFIAIVQPYLQLFQSWRASNKQAKQLWLGKLASAMKRYSGRMLSFMYQHLPQFAQQICDGVHQGFSSGETRLQHQMRMGVTGGAVASALSQRDPQAGQEGMFGAAVNLVSEMFAEHSSQQQRQQEGYMGSAATTGILTSTEGQLSQQQGDMSSTSTAGLVDSTDEQLSQQQGGEHPVTNVTP